MGIASSVAETPLRGYIESEFDRVAKGSCRLFLQQVQMLQPPQDCMIDLRHLATLWKLDANRDGAVTFEELMEFAEFVNERRRIFGSLDFERKLRAQCVEDLWEVIHEERAEEGFADWIVLLVAQGEEHQRFAHLDINFMSRDAIMTLYELLRPYQISAHIDQQGFLDMFQQIGEHMNLMSLQNEELDDWVPTEVVQKWARQIVKAFSCLFRELNLEPPKAELTRPGVADLERSGCPPAT